jgi:hypothetical protein
MRARLRWSNVLGQLHCVGASMLRVAQASAYATLFGIVRPTWLSGGVQGRIGVSPVQLPGGRSSMGARLLWSNVSSSSFVLEIPDDASQSKRGNKIIA